MRILLVNPPRSPHNAILDYAPPEARPFVHRRLVGPPLGLLTLAAAVPGHEVHLLELKGEYDLRPGAPPPRALVGEWMERVRPRLVGVTVIASELPAALEILRAARERDPETVTVAGGLHATLCPRDLADPAVDVVVPGTGTPAFRELAAAVEGGRPLDRVGGVLLNGPGGLRPSAVPAASCDPAGRDFVTPDRSLLEPWLPSYVVGDAPGPSTYVFTSLGCPFRCSFCSIWPQLGGRYLQRDVESVVAELATLDRYPVVRFADANTLVDPAFARRLFERIAAEGIEKTFIMDIRPDTAARHPELIGLLARGGLRVVITGFESFRARELEGYGKDLDPETIGEAVRVFHDHGVLVRGNWLVRPDWGEEDFDLLEEAAARHATAFAGYTILTPMPGTAYHREAAGEIVDRDPAKYNFFNCVLRTRLSPERFHERAAALWRIRRGTATI